MTFTRSLLACRVGKERHLARRLDGRRHAPLVLRAVARHPAGADLAPVAHELPQHGDVLVVDVARAVGAELAVLLLALADRLAGLAGLVGLAGRGLALSRHLKRTSLVGV